MKKNMLLVLAMVICLGACKKERHLDEKPVDITDYIVLFRYSIFAGPEYPMYGAFIFGQDNAAQMITTKKENVAYLFENNTLKFPILKSEIPFKEGSGDHALFYWDPLHETPGGSFGELFIMKKPTVSLLKGKIFGGVAKASNGLEMNLYYQFLDEEVNSGQYRCVRSNTIAGLKSPHAVKFFCYHYGNVAFIKDITGGIEESGVLKDGKLEVLLYNHNNYPHTWTYGSLSEVKE